MATKKKPTAAKKNPAANRKAALQELVEQLNDTLKDSVLGDGMLMNLSGDNHKIETITTGSPNLDVALGGGWAKGRILELYGMESSGKCLVENTRLLTSLGYVALKDLFTHCGQLMSDDDKVTDISDKNIYVVNENGLPEQVVALTHNGKQPVFRVTLSDGRHLEATYNHPVRVLDRNGIIIWKNVGELNEGDIVVSLLGDGNNRVDAPFVNPDYGALLGYLVTEGSGVDENAIFFADNKHVVEEYSALVGSFIADHGIEATVKACQPISSDLARCDVHSKALCSVLSEKYGLLLAGFEGQRIPGVIWRADKDTQKAFLSALFESDGWVGSSGEVNYVSTSRGLIDDVQLLLRSLGYPSDVHKKNIRKQWTLVLSAFDSRRFISDIGFRSARKKQMATERVRTEAKESAVYPAPIANLALSLINHIGGDPTVNPTLETFALGDIGSFFLEANGGFSRENMKNLLTWVDKKEHVSNYARDIASLLRTYEKYSFETVVSNECQGEVNTFDITTAETHTFVANGIVNHNTTVALSTVANVQKEGGICFYVDAENALDPDYMAALGINLDELYVAQPSTAEDSLQLIEKIAMSGQADLVVLDSVASLVTKAQLSGEIGDATVASVARVMSQSLSRIAQSAKRTGTTVLFINQERDDISTMGYGGPKRTTPGGKALRFYASQRVEVTRIGSEKRGDELIANKIKMKVVKNKVAVPFKTAHSTIVFGKGISADSEILDAAINIGSIVAKSGGVFYYANGEDKIPVRGRANLMTALSEDETIRERVFREYEEARTGNLNVKDDVPQDMDNSDI